RDKTEEKVEPKWRRKPKSRPDDILDGALIKFKEQGFKGARIEDIAKHAGLSKGTVYLYFSSKEEMLKALVRRSISPIAASVKNISDHISDDSSDEAAGDMLRKMMLIIAEQLMDSKVGAIPIIIIGEAGKFPELAEFYRKEVIEITMEALSSVLKRGIESEEFRDVEIMFAIRSLIGIVIMYIVWGQVFETSKDIHLDPITVITAQLDIILNGIVMPQE
ncbi:MAG: TetR/AcrR family transcriptional regulator, partial [Emcibacteraceae bacterium]|nr:TetR/AcrR family transcriptional regulator [Emcibacteraceae bacterium]